jgi:glycosyltransferase involved in cell wall biosynthesis
MKNSISLFLSRTGGPPHMGSVGYVNDGIAPLLQRNGWSVHSFQPPLIGNTEEALLPFALAAQHARHDSLGRPRVAMYDCAGTTIRAASKEWADRHVVLYHGLVYGTGNWMMNADIDLHCANSPYLERVLRSLFATPDWKHRQLLNPHGFNAVTNLNLAVPCVEYPDGHPGFAHGSDLSPALLARLDSGMVFGHALQPGKQDLLATLCILYWLNQLALAHVTPRVMLLIAESSLNPEKCRALDALLEGSGATCMDYFVPVPHLNQVALVRLMRSCRFGLAYNKFPEPFGFYVLESVHNGCPVYTNGAGNNRFVLPEKHGINVFESTAMLMREDGAIDSAAYQSVAETIHVDLSRSVEVREECELGAAFIDKTWSPAMFEQSLLAALAKLEQPRVGEQDFEAMEVALSPLVRSLDLSSGQNLNDYACGVLEPDAIVMVRNLLGRKCADLGSVDMLATEDRHGLFRRGLLTLQAARNG